MNQQFWNERYTAHDNVYGTHPNIFLKEQLLLLNTGRLLLPGEGEGRNALFAAKNGWHVTAFDSSQVAVAKTLANAATQQLTINYQVADTESFEADDNSYDVIALIFFHLPPAARTAFHIKIINWLKPDGTLIIEGFNPNQLTRTSGGPADVAMLYTEDMLRSDFEELQIKKLYTLTEELQEGSFHNGTAELIRMVATK